MTSYFSLMMSSSHERISTVLPLFEGAEIHMRTGLTSRSAGYLLCGTRYVAIPRGGFTTGTRCIFFSRETLRVGGGHGCAVPAGGGSRA